MAGPGASRLFSVQADAKGSKLVLWTILVMAVVPLFYWLYTGQVWEDFLITFRASHNLAIGNGLTYEPGRRIYSFTSPINVLLLAAVDWLTRSDDYAMSLLLYNIAAIGAFVTGGLILQRLMREQDAPAMKGAVWIFPVLLTLCVRTTAYVVNGQEAGFWVAFLALGFAATVRGLDRNWLNGGAGWCGLMWTRPDSFVHVTVLAVIAVLWPARSRRGEMRGILKAAGVCTIGYLPWFAGTWWYYGSPVPNSVQAKVGAYIAYGQPWNWTEKIEKIRDAVGGAFTPMYALKGYGWGEEWLWGAAALGLMAATAWIFPAVSRITRCASAACLGSIAYLLFICSYGNAFPWYFVPAGLFASLVCARLLFEPLAGPRPFYQIRRCLVGGGSLLVAGHFFCVSLPYFANDQKILEEGVLKQIGLWLHDHVRPGEKVYLEPIGYIGYYSNASLYDYPGLATPEVVRLRRKGLGFIALIQALRPDWLVLREAELASFYEHSPASKQYGFAMEIDRRKKLMEVMGRRGEQLLVNAHFYVLHRIDKAGAKPGPPAGGAGNQLKASQPGS